MPKPTKYKFHKTYYSLETAQYNADKFKKKGLKTRIVKLKLRYGTTAFNLWVERR